MPDPLSVLLGPGQGGRGGGASWSFDLQVLVSREQFLLLGCVWQEDQEFIEDLVEVLAQELLAAFVVLLC